MLTLDECVGLSGLSEDEAEVVAEHEHLPLIVAAEMGNELLKTPKGIWRIKQMMLDCLERAKLTGHKARARQIDRIYLRFNAAHPTGRVL